jgi:hypothetical protein
MLFIHYFQAQLFTSRPSACMHSLWKDDQVGLWSLIQTGVGSETHLTDGVQIQLDGGIRTKSITS